MARTPENGPPPGPLNWRRQTPGPRGLPGKIGLAALALVLLVALVVGLLALSYASRRAEAPAANTYSAPP